MPKKHKRDKKSGIPRKLLAEQVLSILSGNDTKGFNYKQISKKLNIDEEPERKMIPSILEDLKNQGLIQEIYEGKFKAKATRGNITGNVDLTRMGYGFIKTDEMEDEVFVSAKNLKTALHGDKVKVSLYAKRKGARPEGEVV